MNKKRSRHNKILQSLDLGDNIAIEELASEFGLSEATIRRDLEELEREGRIVRTRGGARTLSGLPEIAKKFEERSRIRLEEKKLIIDEIEELIPGGCVLTLDNGTTSWLLAKRLKQKKNLTVATHSLPIIEELGSAGDINLLVSGGIFRQRNLDFTGIKAVDFFRDIYADIAVITCDSVKPGLGFYKISEASAEIARAMAASAKTVYIIADHTKIDAAASFRFLKPEEADTFFTDSLTPEADRKKMSDECYTIVYC
jgi:DeoR/GlpR family transcriptional regulator of sugar metabolism